MKEKSTYDLIDDQLLQLISTWSELNDRMIDAALYIPNDAFEIEEETGEVVPELMICRQFEIMLDGLMASARKILSAAEDAGLIGLTDWHTINTILLFIGSDEPLEAIL